MTHRALLEAGAVDEGCCLWDVLAVLRHRFELIWSPGMSWNESLGLCHVVPEL